MSYNSSMYYEAENYPSPGLPVEDPCLSFWLQRTRYSTLLGHRTTEHLPDTVEVAIIGSGLSGAATAYYLFNGPNPPKSVVMLEARDVCEGATGRNGGHCRPDVFQGYSNYKQVFGKEQALKIIQQEMDTLNLTIDLIEKEGIDCDLWKGNSLDIALDEPCAEKRRKSYHEFVADGGKVEGIVKLITDSSEAKRVSRMYNAILTAIFPAASLWPYKLVAHLLQLCIEKFGLNLQTFTPVTSVKADNSKWILETPRGNVAAEKIVYATNAYTATLLPEFLGCIVPGQGQCAAIVPTNAYSGKRMLANTASYSWGEGNYDYLVQRPQDGIIILGGGKHNVDSEKIRDLTDDTTKQPEITQYLKKAMETHFEGWGKERPGEGYLYDWTGIMAYTRESVPFVGKLEGKPNAYINAGHCGHGMARITSCSKGIASLISGGSWEDTKLPECFQPTTGRLKKE
ncbi:FAD dependent oxidoreductase [Rhodocollybia butyracea]|uniref:FAD dependent oxidoreductase n=1 Tax=Rhodocollybia butyracea TaxID=206335 RepID=A0A9P5Q5C6_9AGAR|nr:FAD dependent oxidoreductase [Rhodocollybia butyracea]